MSKQQQGEILTNLLVLKIVKIRILFVLKHVVSSSFKVLLLCQYFNPLQKLTSYLIFIKFLQVLNLDSIQLRSDSIQKIATNLPNLTELNLRNTWLSKRAVLSLVNHLTAVNIEKLNLEMLKNVDDEIVRKLVSKCHKLNELNLKETSITSFSIQIIIQYLKTTIVRLDLSENNIDKAKIVDLEKRLPNLKQVKLVSMDLNHIGLGNCISFPTDQRSQYTEYRFVIGTPVSIQPYFNIFISFSSSNTQFYESRIFCLFTV